MDELRKSQWATVASGLVAIAAVAALALIIVVNDGFPQRLNTNVQELRSLEVMWQWDCPYTLKLPTERFDACVFGAPWETAERKAVLWGDSHADHMAPIVEAALTDNNTAVLLYRPGCPAALGQHVFRPRVSDPNYVDYCATKRDAMVEFLTLNPDVSLIILAASWTVVSTEVKTDDTLPAELTGAQRMKAGTSEVLNLIEAPGRRFIIITDMPIPGVDPVPCALTGEGALLRRGGNCIQLLGQKTRKFYDDWQFPVATALAEIATERTDTTVIRPHPALCNEDSCRLYLDGEFLYRDGSHIRRNLRLETRRHLAFLVGITEALIDD